ncbi:MAG: 4'-phosphopantetheinyl transferase superfamily protein [Ruminococcus sp.]|nr:4'-phosphopantetheinyl transferase superfamily protein [Ruminococcus sp.]
MGETGNMSELHIRVMCIPENIKFEECKGYLSVISSSRFRKINKFLFDKDKLVSIATELFVKYCITCDTGLMPVNYEFEYNEYGKPYIGFVSDYFFSVSHSHRTIVFVSSDSEIGVDIEKISRNVSAIQIARRLFTDDEADYICRYNNSDLYKRFFEIWTRKEAYVKRLGTGLYTSIESFSVLEECRNCRLMTFCHNNQMISVCCDRKYDSVCADDVSFNVVRQFLNNCLIKLSCGQSG